MSNLFKALVSACVLSFSFAAAAADQTMKSDASSVDTACANEAKTANCGNDKVGSGLMKCIHEYKEKNPSFKVSEGCHAAMKQMHSDKAAGK